MEKQRLDKIIASTGRFSRREVKDLIRHGRVWVDGAPACSAQDQVDPETVAITINGEPMLYRRFTWVMLNKPAGYLSATEDGRGTTVLDLLPPELRFGYTDSIDFKSRQEAERSLGCFLLVNIDEFDQININQQGFLKHLL